MEFYALELDYIKILMQIRACDVQILFAFIQIEVYDVKVVRLLMQMKHYDVAVAYFPLGKRSHVTLRCFSCMQMKQYDVPLVLLYANASFQDSQGAVLQMKLGDIWSNFYYHYETRTVYTAIATCSYVIMIHILCVVLKVGLQPPTC